MRALARTLAEDAASSALLTDFDGSLAPIVERPEDARAPASSIDVLHRLAERFRVVAVISGRPLSYLAEALELSRPDSRLVAYGLYGMEVGGPQSQTDNAARAASFWSELAERARAEVPGAIVEDKARSLVLHWRSDPDLEPKLRELAADLARQHQLVVRPARRALELFAPDASDKRHAVLRVASSCARACYIGDDNGDLAAFDALDELEQQGVATLRVGVTSEEMPDELRARSDVLLAGPAQVLAFLEVLDELSSSG